MITIADRKNNILCQLVFNDAKVFKDSFSQPKDSDLSTYQFSVLKNDSDLEKIGVGNIVYVQDGDFIRVFEIFRIESSNDMIDVFCFDGGIDLINEEVDKFEAQEPQTLEYYIQASIIDSGWEIGKNQSPSDIKKKLKFDAKDSAVSRIRKIANSFNVFVHYNFELAGTKIERKTINFTQRQDSQKHIRLEYGLEVGKITKIESIENLVTALATHGEEIDLNGFSIPDEDRGIWKVIGTTLIHLPSTRIWSRHINNVDYDENSGNGAVVGYYDSSVKSQEELYEETKLKILQLCFPEIEYNVDVVDLPERIRRGDFVTVVDHDFKPAIVVTAVVASVEDISFVDKTKGKITLTNFTGGKFSNEQQLQTLRSRMQSISQSLSDIPYVLEIQSSNGTSFKQHAFTTTLVARVTRNDIDVTNQFKYFKWKKVSEFSDIPDSHWNEENSQVGRSIEVSHDDVGKQSTFFCYALKDDKEVVDGFIVIKSMATRLFEGETPPERPDVGDYWFQRKGKYTYMHIWDGSQWQLLIDDENLDKVSNVIKEVEKQVETIEKQIEVSDSNAVKAIEEFEKKLETFKDDIIHEGLPPHVLETALTDAGFDKETIAQLKKKALANSDTLETVVDLLGSDGRTTYNRNRATITHGDIPLGTESLSVGHNGDGFEIGEPYVISWEAVCNLHASSDVPIVLNSHRLLPVSVVLRPRNTLYPIVEKTLHGASETIYAVYHDTYTVTATSDWYHTIAGRTVTIADNQPVVLSLLLKEIADGNLENKYIGEWSNSPEIILHGGTR